MSRTARLLELLIRVQTKPRFTAGELAEEFGSPGAPCSGISRPSRTWECRGQRVEVPADLSGTTPFQERVLRVVKGIPSGQVRPYAWVAREAGSPKASRAVGTIMANNPVPLLIPCHRVIKNDGTTGSYAFGAGEKVGLLEGEGVPVEEIAGSLYLATPTTRIFCHATCANARRIKSENRRHFRSAKAAVNAGFRPCEVCRPVVAG